MERSNIVDFARREEMTDALTDLLRTGAQQLIAAAVEAELGGYMAQFSELRTDNGHAAVVRNGHHPARPVQTGIGPVSVRIPKVRSKTGKPVSFRSALVPPYIRKTRSLEAALPWLKRARLCAERVGAQPQLGNALNVLGDVARKAGDLELAEESLREALRIFDSSGQAWSAVVRLNLVGVPPPSKVPTTCQ
ncbi:MAG: tetratricopeptide repeat protein, partial [Paracoccaceae bacterium]